LSVSATGLASTNEHIGPMVPVEIKKIVASCSVAVCSGCEPGLLVEGFGSIFNFLMLMSAVCTFGVPGTPALHHRGLNVRPRCRGRAPVLAAKASAVLAVPCRRASLTLT
jgi:hypothetical protein